MCFCVCLHLLCLVKKCFWRLLRWCPKKRNCFKKNSWETAIFESKIIKFPLFCTSLSKLHNHFQSALPSYTSIFTFFHLLKPTCFCLKWQKNIIITQPAITFDITIFGMIYRQNTLKNIIIHICNILCGEIYFLDLKVISKIHSRLTTLVHYTLSHKELQLPVIMYLASRGVCVHRRPMRWNLSWTNHLTITTDPTHF